MTQFIRLKGGVFSICYTFLINTPMANPMSKRWCFTINYSEENPGSRKWPETRGHGVHGLPTRAGADYGTDALARLRAVRNA